MPKVEDGNEDQGRDSDLLAEEARSVIIHDPAARWGCVARSGARRYFNGRCRSADPARYCSDVDQYV
jgi:hypothetical protein